VVEGAASLRRAVRPLDVVHGDGEVVVARRLQVALEEVQLRAADRQPLHGEAEVRRRDRLGPEQVDVEVDGVLQVARVDAHVVDAAAHITPSVVRHRVRCAPKRRGEHRMSEIIVVGSFKARPGKEADAAEAMRALVQPTHAEDGRADELFGEDASIVRYEESPAGEPKKGSLATHAGDRHGRA
jgi:hypothetical protein